MKCLCHRCGKILSSEQALAYHLRKKITCKSLFCKCCNIYFTGKTKYDTHICNSERKQIKLGKNEKNDITIQHPNTQNRSSWP